MRQLALATSVALLALPAWGTEAIHIDIRDLTRDKKILIGQRISTHGCLVNSRHGSFIKPCGSRASHEVILVLDPTEVGLDAFGELKIDYASHVEGDFSGVLVEMPATRPPPIPGPAPATHVFLKIESVTDATAYSP